MLCGGETDPDLTFHKVDAKIQVEGTWDSIMSGVSVNPKDLRELMWQSAGKGRLWGEAYSKEPKSL